MRRAAKLLATLLALPAGALAADPPGDAAALAARHREAVYLEEVIQDLDAAVAAYLEVAAGAGAGSEASALARLRAAGCRELQGRADDAAALYAAVLRDAPADLAAQRAEARRRLAALTAAGRAPSGAEAAIDRLESDDPAERYGAIAELRALPTVEAAAALVRRLGPDAPLAGPKVRHYGVILLGHLREASAVPALRARLADPIAEVRCNAAASLLRLGDRTGVPTLEEELLSSAATIRSLAAQHLARAGERAAAPALVDDLASPDSYVRSSAIQALVRLFGDDLGFIPDAPEVVRAEARRRWEERVRGRAAPGPVKAGR